MQATRWRRRFVATGIVLVLALLSPAMCLAGAGRESPDDLCVMGMADDSGETAAKLDCCAAQSPDNAALLAHTVSVAPPVLLAAPVGVGQLSPAAPHLATAIAAGAPKITRTPTYLLVSLFRI